MERRGIHMEEICYLMKEMKGALQSGMRKTTLGITAEGEAMGYMREEKREKKKKKKEKKESGSHC